MSSPRKSDLQLEIAHILFTDLVGYSKLLINEQHELLEELNQIVRSTEAFRSAEAAGKLIPLPTGDGMALAFRTTPEAPVQCALEISQALTAHPEIQLRMGINSGPISVINDVNQRPNVAGAGINMAQRVMDCGDAGHILLSERVADDLSQYRQWQPHLHDLGEFEVKHGVTIHVVNFYTDELGNRELPTKLRGGKQRRLAARASGQNIPARRRNVLLVAVTFAAVALLTGLWIFLSHRAPSSTAASARTIPVPVVTEKSIAVLPFLNLSDDNANAYFALALQDEILTRLSKIADLKVISRTSTEHYKSAPETLREIGRQLGVANILEGSVQKSGDSVRVNVQLIRSETDAHIWAEIYDRKLTDLLVIQSEIAKTIAGMLQAKLSGSEQQALVVKLTENDKAYDAYIRGLTTEQDRTLRPGVSLGKAIQFYEQAIQLDSGFVAAWSRLSRAHGSMYQQGHDVTATRRSSAEQALSTAQKLQPNAPETLLAQAYFQYRVLRNYEAAKATFELVRKVFPGSSEVPSALALITRRQGHWDESIEYWKQSLRLDPLNAQLLMDCGETYSMLRRYAEAFTVFDQALTIRPNDSELIASKAELYQAQGNLEAAGKLLTGMTNQPLTGRAPEIRINQLVLERHYDEAIRLLQADLSDVKAGEAQGLDIQLRLAGVQKLANDRTGARETADAVRSTLELLCKEEPDSPFLAAALSQIYAVLDEKAAALKEAERAVTLRPSAGDAVTGPGFEENLANIQAKCGENERAISALQRLLSVPYKLPFGQVPVTKALLRLDPDWDGLRADPRFQKLVEN